MRVTVIGAGNAGHAMAGDLSLAGADICLYELPEFSDNLNAVRNAGGIHVDGGPGWRHGFGRVGVSTNIAEALNGADCVFIVTQSLAHERLAELCAPHLQAGQAVILFTSYGGAFLFRRALRALGRNGVLVGETVTLPYYCRLTGPARVGLWGKPYKFMLLGTIPAADVHALVSSVGELYPWLRPAESVLQTMLLNPNVLRHPVGTLFNIGRIEHAGGEFWIYREGFTPSVWRVFESLDAEKMALMRALGLEPVSYFVSRGLMTDYTLDEQAAEGSQGPESADSRYLTEDVPIGLVPRAELGERLGIPVPTTRAIIHLASVINERDYASEGRTLARLGVADASGREIRQVVDEGRLD